jgi:hypothetical protein
MFMDLELAALNMHGSLAQVQTLILQAIDPPLTMPTPKKILDCGNKQSSPPAII